MSRNIISGIVLVIMSYQILYSQFVYNDIIPDTTISTNGGVYKLDLNRDGIPDFKIELAKLSFPATMNSVDISILADYFSIASYSLDGCGNFANAFDTDYAIKNYANWSNNATVGTYTLLTTTCMSTGFFNGQTNKYLGLKMIKNGTIFYGWVGIDVAANASWFKMKNYAFNISSINAGIIVGINSFQFSDMNGNIHLYPNPANNILTIEDTSPGKEKMVSIFNIHGQLLMNQTLNQAKTIIDISDLAKGIYFLKLNTDKGGDAKTFLKE